MEACSSDRNKALPAYLCPVVTPLKLEAWRKALSDYPDQRFAGSSLGSNRVLGSAAIPTLLKELLYRSHLLAGMRLLRIAILYGESLL